MNVRYEAVMEDGSHFKAHDDGYIIGDWGADIGGWNLPDLGNFFPIPFKVRRTEPKDTDRLYLVTETRATMLREGVISAATIVGDGLVLICTEEEIRHALWGGRVSSYHTAELASA